MKRIQLESGEEGQSLVSVNQLVDMGVVSDLKSNILNVLGRTGDRHSPAHEAPKHRKVLFQPSTGAHLDPQKK